MGLFDFVAQKIPGTHYVVADALSCNNITLFSYLVPATDPTSAYHQKDVRLN